LSLKGCPFGRPFFFVDLQCCFYGDNRNKSLYKNHFVLKKNEKFGSLIFFY